MKAAESEQPYYDRDGLTIYHGDIRDVLVTLEPESVDVAIVDPPYGETSLWWDVPVRWQAFLLASHVLKPSASIWVFGSMRLFMVDAAEFSAWSFAQDLVWEKHNGSNFHADRFRRVHEHVAQFYAGRWADVYKAPVKRMDATARTVRRKTGPTHTGHIEKSAYASVDGGPRLERSVLRVRSCHGYAEHPTQKPLGILTPLIEYSCPLGGVVLDPFMGSGSSLVAAKMLGRRAIGIESNAEYCAVAARRLAQEVLPLGACA